MLRELVTVAIINLSVCYLKVYGPDCAVQRSPKDIEYKLSNFGQIPYGQTIIGKLRLPHNPELCTLDNEPAVSKVQNSNTKDILLVKRGGCKFTEKVINAQNLGAEAVVIYDNLPGTSPSVLMMNDGHGHLAEIPSLLISNTDGLTLLETQTQCQTLPLLKLLFEIDQKQTSQVTLWVDSNNVSRSLRSEKPTSWPGSSTKTATTRASRTGSSLR